MNNLIIKDKRFAVLWSGGLDSTYLIQYLLERQCASVDAYNIKILNNETQTKSETNIAILSNILISKYKNFVFKDFGSLKIENTCGSSVHLQQVPMFLFFSQYISDYDYIAIGYVMNDDAISYLEDIVNCYDSYSNIKEKHPPIVFPLSKASKKTIYCEINKELLKNISFCEEPKEEKDIFIPCKNCPSCLRQLAITAPIVNDEIKVSQKLIEKSRKSIITKKKKTRKK